jgi:hypothetical protein
LSRTNKISGTKTFEYVIVPRIQGRKTIPSIAFAYFDPNKRQYITKSSPEYEIDVAKGDGSIAAGSGFSKEEVKLLNEDIRFIKTSNSDLATRNGNRLIPIWFWLGLILPALVLGIVLSVQKRNQKLSSNTQLLKYRKAEKLAKKRLKTAQKLMTGSESLAFYSEISQAMSGYLEDKLSIQKSEFTLDKALSKLNEKKVPDELVQKVKDIYEKCEFARFAPASQNISAEQSMYEETINTIVKVDSHLNSIRSK